MATDPQAIPTEGGGLCIDGGYGRHVQLSPAEAKVALAALLEAEGMEKRWAARTPHNLLQLTETEDIARGMVDAANNTTWVKGASTVVEIYVPKEPT